jgi:hypothetical protein
MFGAVARDFAGRSITVVGICAALLAVSLPVFGSARYVSDGTVAAFLLVLIALASWLPAEVGPASLGAALGAAAFGFFLRLPAVAAFDQFGSLKAGAWLGLCAALIPIGGLLQSAKPGAAPLAAGPVTLVPAVGLALVVVGVWLPAENEASYWDASSSGHALGLLVILLAVITAFAIALRHATAALLLAATTFGLVEVSLVGSAFEDFGVLGSGAWLGACGGLLLLSGVLWLQPGRVATLS